LTAALACLLAACGQTGPLYMPDEGITTPVEIRTAPAEAAPAAPAEPAAEKADVPAEPPAEEPAAPKKDEGEVAPPDAGT
jgi:predicted small lipoprotein YifL